MVWVKKSHFGKRTRNIKKIYILCIIFPLFSSVFLPGLNASMAIHSSIVPIVSVTERPDLVVGGNAVSLSGNVDPNYAITEEQKYNNHYETTTSVTPWWNANWHYRRIYNVTGTGNISLSMNFTTLLASLGVVNKTFDNASIAIVRYYPNSSMVLVNKTWFNESTLFHNRTNAVGTLLWTVPESSLFGVYFDVIENRGVRTPMTETLDLTQSGSVSASMISTQGWWSEFTITFETYYPLNTKLLINVYTTALAKNMTAQFFWKDQPDFNLSLHTLNNLNWINTTQNLSNIGDWTVRVIGYDDAGYQSAPLTAGFYVGQPDLIVSALTMPTVCYLGYTVAVIANIHAVNTTVQHVNVSFLIDNIINQTQRNLTIQKNENRTLQFSWKPTKKGEHNITVRINNTDSNPGNNKKWKIVTVEGIPDMAVLNISVSPTPVNEGNPVAVTAYIRNTGDGNATDYQLVLYCEQNENNQTMHYIDEKNSTTVNLKKNEYKNVTLTWEKTRYGKTNFHGEWAVGIEIRNTTQTPDKHGANNYKALFHVLWVIPAERKPPILYFLEYPETQEQGNPVLIRIKAVDDSGIDTVVISIKMPNKTFGNATMTAVEDDRYEYTFNAVQIGNHYFTIKATDLSPSKNQSTVSGSFEVTGDKTPPTVSFFGINPLIQLPYNQVEIRCITTDFSGINFVEATILNPDNRSEVHVMSNVPSDTKYVYTNTYERIGKYRVSLTIEDKKGNTKITEEKTFWITNDLNDIDSDGMPNNWEIQYGFNPYDPHDASLDADNDSVTNLKEYQQGTNPLEEVSSSSELIERLQENGLYLITSLIVFVIIVLLAWYGIRRRKP